MLFNKMSRETGLIKRLDLLSGGLLTDVYCTETFPCQASKSHFNPKVQSVIKVLASISSVHCVITGVYCTCRVRFNEQN